MTYVTCNKRYHFLLSCNMCIRVFTRTSHMNPDLNFNSHNFVFHFQDMLLTLDIGLTSSFSQIELTFWPLTFARNSSAALTISRNSGPTARNKRVTSAWTHQNIQLHSSALPPPHKKLSFLEARKMNSAHEYTIHEKTNAHQQTKKKLDVIHRKWYHRWLVVCS